MDQLNTYDQDFYQWTLEQAKAIEDRNLNILDWANLKEEIEALGRSEYNAVVSLLLKEIEHLLKIDYVPIPDCKNKWTAEVIAFKKGIKRKISPSMKPKLEIEFEEIYTDAREIVEAEYKITLPKESPYNLDQLLNHESTTDYLSRRSIC
ncbi:DUF29 domain-containing protein [Gloeocapsa sp. PCC 73106]|uniref:DUF29 domain-containing protein n=1 Tax=Gloeocapsa sp. PCC 73106 TaxID=102232 RepID=UPI0002AC1485|nr:DUF29 domain-containing protein [Gloeocapsa sp. PCC 73106]ELR98357.1 protein of unknown function DUF29 [Gloeocapsa sp. PCC 73106]